MPWRGVEVKIKGRGGTMPQAVVVKASKYNSSKFTQNGISRRLFGNDGDRGPNCR
jgi:hypothetical protein